MRIYLMARYQRYPEMQVVAERLVAMGHTIVSRWIWGEHAASDDAIGTGTINELERRFAEEDVADLQIAECCIGFSELPGTINRGGRFVELGMALAWGKRVMVVGGKENVFHALPQVEHVHGLDDLLQAIGRVAPVPVRKNAEAMALLDKWYGEF